MQTLSTPGAEGGKGQGARDAIGASLFSFLFKPTQKAGLMAAGLCWPPLPLTPQEMSHPESDSRSLRL